MKIYNIKNLNYGKQKNPYCWALLLFGVCVFVSVLSDTDQIKAMSHL